MPSEADHKPSYEESKELHDLMLQLDHGVQNIQGDSVVQMKDTEMQSVKLMFPQDRNLHGKVFGGILMRSVSGHLISAKTGY